jgi:hypothetical protein
LGEGYATTFQELLDTTDWDAYGHKSGNAKCADCMVHCGYEPTAVAHAFGSLSGFLTTARLFLFGTNQSTGGSPPTPPSDESRQPLVVRPRHEQVELTVL